MRAAATGIYDALLVATRLHSHYITNMIIGIFTLNKDLGQSVNPQSRRLFHECYISNYNAHF